MSVSELKDLVLVSKEIKRIERLLIDKEWEGKSAEAEARDLERLRAMQARGELYDPLF